MPVTSQGDKVPVTSQGDRVPVTSQGDRVPVTSQGDKVPVTSQGDRVLVTSQGDRVPVTSQSDRVQMTPVYAVSTYSIRFVIISSSHVPLFKASNMNGTCCNGNTRSLQMVGQLITI